MEEQARREQGERIRQLRIGLGMGQVEFAAIFSKSHQAISKWERGVTSPELKDWFKLGRISGSLDYLVYGIKTKPVTDSPIIGAIFARPGASFDTPSRLQES